VPINGLSQRPTKYGPYLVAGALHNRVNSGPFKVAGAYTFRDNNTIEFILRYIESPHTETYRIKLDGDKITLDDESIFNRNTKRPEIKGVLRKDRANPPRLIIRGGRYGIFT
jgi:hypothetical protein